ncbi:MAG TPA: YdcF family protein [Vicinamibacteria bacterium]|nr:YdcF family protein [Vicinamibacteria bacterium]
MAGARPTGRLTRLGVGLTAGSLAGLIVADLNLPSLVSYFGDRTYLVPAIAVLGALLWLTPLRRLAGGAVALLALLWLAVAFTPLTSWLAEGLVRRDPVEAADAVFVFASRVQEDGDPTTDAMSRLLKGVELVAEGRAPRLLVSELSPPAGPYAPLARAWLEEFARRGEVVSVGRILNTRDEAVAVARLCRERGWARVLAVTSPTHSRRAAAALEREGLVVFSVPSVETRFDLERLHWPGDRREAFAAVAHERLGLVVYKRRGWIE